MCLTQMAQLRQIPYFNLPVIMVSDILQRPGNLQCICSPAFFRPPGFLDQLRVQPRHLHDQRAQQSHRRLPVKFLTHLHLLQNLAYQ